MVINNEQRTTNNEQRTTNNEQRTTNNEQRTTKLMLKKTKRPPGNYTKKLITSLAFMICVWGQSLQPVSAEGSRDLVENFGFRPYTEWLPGVSIAGIPRKTLLKVFVKTGETINFGSSVHKGFGGGTQDIVYRSPNGTQNGSCDVLSTGPGFIDTLAKETAGPLPATDGYDPCQRVATETGIYEVEFHGPSETSTANPPVRAFNVQFPTDGTQEATVAAWDITVTSGGVRQPGRVFTNYLSLSMGGNSRVGVFEDLGLNSILFVQTKDGYRYEVTLDRLDPGNFIFFGNNRGFIDKTDNSNLYHSITAPDEALNFIGNVGLHLPTKDDTSTEVTHRVFFNRPDSMTLLGLGIPLTATLPQAPPDFKFTGIAGNTTKVNTGGKFTFTTNQFGRYQIVIDTNQDGIYGNSNDRILTGGIVSGLNTVNWDGRDQANTALPVGTYNAKVYVTAGEYHFPLLDAESNAGGLRIIMENAQGAFNNTATDVDGDPIDNSTVYYNDSNYTTKNGTTVNLDPTGTQVASIPRDGTKGVNTAAFGRHEWTRLYGNTKGIDTWTYFLDPSGTATPIVIVAANTEVVGTKEVAFKTDADTSGSVTINDIMEYTVTYSNVGNTNATDFVIKDTLPAQLTYVPNSLSIVSQTANLTIDNNYNGDTDVNLITPDPPGQLEIGETITIKFRAKVNAAAANISNQAIATFIPSGSVSTVTILTDAVPTAGGVTNPTTPGQIVTQIADDGINIGNDTSKTDDDDPTLFSTQLPPKLLFVKRITALNSDSTNFNVFDPLNPDQANNNWPSGNTTYLRG
ncbi:MAG: isopeptide-forming domain-containing fimbrial protein, partial [Aphanizomenon sp.]